MFWYTFRPISSDQIRPYRRCRDRLFFQIFLDGWITDKNPSLSINIRTAPRFWQRHRRHKKGKKNFFSSLFSRSRFPWLTTYNSNKYFQARVCIYISFQYKATNTRSWALSKYDLGVETFLKRAHFSASRGKRLDVSSNKYQISPILRRGFKFWTRKKNG